MKAALLESAFKVVMTQTEMPCISKPDEVLIQVRAVGICGSELHAYEGTHPFRKPPAVMGHEMSGVISSVGAAVHDFKPGDRVALDPQWTCGGCEYCKSGLHNLCPSKIVAGVAQWPGGFGEYVVARQSLLFKLPRGFSFPQGAVLEPLSVAVHAVRRAGICPGSKVAVLGSGSIGGLVCGVARAMGASLLLAADIRPHCLDAACARLGATHGFLLPDPDLAPAALELAPDGLDAVFICADDPELINLAIPMVKRRGIIVLVALMTTAPLSFMAYEPIRKELHIIGAYMANRIDMTTSIRFAKSGLVDVNAIITHVLPIEQAQRGMELARTKEEGAIKVILSFEGG